MEKAELKRYIIQDSDIESANFFEDPPEFVRVDVVGDAPIIGSSLQQKFEDRSARIAILGMGYVGLPLAVVFAEAGFEVTGIDPDERKINAL